MQTNEEKKNLKPLILKDEIRSAWDVLNKAEI